MRIAATPTPAPIPANAPVDRLVFELVLIPAPDPPPVSADDAEAEAGFMDVVGNAVMVSEGRVEFPFEVEAERISEASLAVERVDKETLPEKVCEEAGVGVGVAKVESVMTGMGLEVGDGELEGVATGGLEEFTIGGLEGVAIGGLEGVAVVEGREDSVETTSPLPFSTTPSWSLQHAGSLSQQKLPSAH
jgi:hypothetical protein